MSKWVTNNRRTRNHLCCVFSILTVRETRTPPLLGVPSKVGCWNRAASPCASWRRRCAWTRRLATIASSACTARPRAGHSAVPSTGWRPLRCKRPSTTTRRSRIARIQVLTNGRGGALINVYVDPLSRCHHTASASLRHGEQHMQSFFQWGQSPDPMRAGRGGFFLS